MEGNDKHGRRAASYPHHLFIPSAQLRARIARDSQYISDARMSK